MNDGGWPILNRVNLVPSRRWPFLNRRYPYRGRRKMERALGKELAASTIWRVSPENNAGGRLKDIFATTPCVHKWEHYLPIYESVIRSDVPITMLEIGVFHGGSLAMWRRYLHPESRIVGIDIDPTCAQFDRPEDNVHVRIGSQADPAFLRRTIKEFGPFDIVLDDGSHRTSHMIDSFRHLFAEGLTEDGFYIAEDVHSNYWQAYRDSRLSFLDFIHMLVDAMHAHYHSATSETNFRVGHISALDEVEVPRVTTLVNSIRIFDSLVIVDKSTRPLPRSIYTG